MKAGMCGFAASSFVLGDNRVSFDSLRCRQPSASRPRLGRPQAVSPLRLRAPISSASAGANPLPAFSPARPLRALVLISGGGRSLANLCARIGDNSLRNVAIVGVVASKRTAGGVAVAAARGLPVHIVRARDHPAGVGSFSDAVSRVADALAADLVVLAGWMHFYQIPDRYAGRVVNIHPSLIPAFCGKGYYGDRVHAAVLEFGAKVTGCTVHLADNEYDHGPIILQRAVEVREGDTPEELAARVFEAEKEALPEAIQLFADSRLEMEGRHVRIRAGP